MFDEVIAAGHVVSECTVRRICSDMGWWSVFGQKERGKKGKVGAPAHRRTTAWSAASSPQLARASCG